MKEVRYTGKVVRATDTTNLVDLGQWCRDYNRYTIYPCSFDKRFAIGFYQIWDYIDWKESTVNRDAAVAAASIHFIMVLEACELRIEAHLPIELKELHCLGELAWKWLMLHLSRAQQHILYRSQVKGMAGTVKTVRSTRYKPDLLERDLSTAIIHLLSAIKPEQRSTAIFDATSTMTQKL